MSKYFVLLIILFYSSGLYSSEAFFRPVERKVAELTEGDSFKGVIELWNITNVSPEMVYELENKVFLNSFYVVSLEKPRWSENNPDVVVIEGTFIVAKKLQENKQVWKLGGVEIDVTIKEISTTPFTNKKKGFAILEGDYKLEDPVDYTLPIALALVLLFLILILYYFKKKGNLKEVEPVKKTDWLNIFKNAKTRNDFSTIYEKRDEWIDEIGNRKSVYMAFTKSAEELLFKPSTEDFELEELKVSSESIIRELSK